MKQLSYQFSYQVFDSIHELNEQDAGLLKQAKKVSETAYAPYSQFMVGAVAQFINGEMITGTNQENAAYPVGLCAERVLLSSAATLFPGLPIETIAISYKSKWVESDHPISPCGLCRQSLLEYEIRVKQPIRLLLGGMEGNVFVIEKAGMLLPLSFSGIDLTGA